MLQAYFLNIDFKNLIPSFTNDSYLWSKANTMESYNDFTNKWYSSIGYQICLTWAILAISPHIAMPIYHYLS